jgi:hypothetical protein
METVPAMEVNKTSSSVQKVTEEMRTFRKFFLKSMSNRDNDLRKFWLRKSKKPVLAVLLVNKPEQGLVMYRGTNMEVSMPTGSLCAERNVIGTALANDPGLRREDLMMVAVLSLPLSDEDQEYTMVPPRQPMSPPPGVKQSLCTTIEDTKTNKVTATTESDFFSAVEEKLTRYQRPENIRRSMSMGSFASIIECDDSYESDESWVKEGALPASKGDSTLTENNNNNNMVSIVKSGPPIQVVYSESTAPVRKLVKLYSDDGMNPHDKGSTKCRDNETIKTKTAKSWRKKKRTVLVHSSEVRFLVFTSAYIHGALILIGDSLLFFKFDSFRAGY